MQVNSANIQITHHSFFRIVRTSDDNITEQEHTNIYNFEQDQFNSEEELDGERDNLDSEKEGLNGEDEELDSEQEELDEENDFLSDSEKNFILNTQT